MNKGNAAQAAATEAASGETILEEINRRLAVITPEQFHNPEMKMPKGAHSVGMASEGLKALFTLHSMAVNEHHTLEKAVHAVQEEMLKNLMSGNIARFKEVLSGQLDGKIAEMERLQADLAAKRDFQKNVTDLFWSQVKRSFPTLADKDRIGIADDWLFFWLNEPSLKGVGGFQVIGLTGDGMLERVPPELAEILGAILRR